MLLLWTRVYKCLFEFLLSVLFDLLPRSRISGSYGSSMFSFFEEPSSCFPGQLHSFKFPWMAHKCSNFSASTTTSGFYFFFSLLDNNHPNDCEVVSHDFYLSKLGFYLHEYSAFGCFLVSAWQFPVYGVIMSLFLCCFTCFLLWCLVVFYVWLYLFISIVLHEKIVRRHYFKVRMM